MKRLPSLAALLLPILAAASGQAAAETFEVQMLNKGAEGAMVFEPAYVKAAPGEPDVTSVTEWVKQPFSVSDAVTRAAELLRRISRDRAELRRDFRST